MTFGLRQDLVRSPEEQKADDVTKAGTNILQEALKKRGL